MQTETSNNGELCLLGVWIFPDTDLADSGVRP
jgi:hypothetical protein